MTTSQPSPHLISLSMALAVAAACVSTLAAAQQPAPPQPDRAALERQAVINKRPDTPGTGAFGHCETAFETDAAASQIRH